MVQRLVFVILFSLIMFGNFYISAFAGLTIFPVLGISLFIVFGLLGWCLVFWIVWGLKS